MKNRSLNILIVSLLLLAVMATMIIVFIQRAHDEFEENITVSSNGVTESVLTVQDLKLNPTEKKEYEVNLVCEASGSYDISIDYEELFNGGMKSFVNVVVKCGGLTVFDGTLTELIDEDMIIHFEETLEADDPVVVNFCYEMPDYIGNEAQGTYADFNIRIKIEKI